MIGINKSIDNLSVDDLAKHIHEKLDYTLSYEDRVEVINKINHDVGRQLEDYYISYKRKNLKIFSNKSAYDKICNVMDKMSEYILFSKHEHELDDTIKDEIDMTAKGRKNTYTFTQESNLRDGSHKDVVSYNQYVSLMNSTEELEDIRYDDQNHATYTLKDFSERMDTCPYVKDYQDFNKSARKIIEVLDTQLKYHELLKLEYKDMDIEYDIPDLIYKNEQGKEFKFTTKQLAALKNGIGYNKNNSKLIDQDVMFLYKSWFRPIYFSSVTRSKELKRKMDLDFMDREHVLALVKGSCLGGELKKFDKYIKRLDDLVEQAPLTNLEQDVYNAMRKGKGLDLDKNSYDDNMFSIRECARIIGKSQTKVNNAFNSLVDKIVDKYEEIYEDYYFTFIARGTYKTCSKCGQVKLANDRYFSPHKQFKDGFYPYCKECRRKS